MASRSQQPQQQQQQQQQQQRDMVYCHQCENEWFRDEHGLECPECHSDFTEIIEADHDPREDAGQIPPDHGHDEFYGAPDPDEDDIDGIRWQQAGPGRMTATFDRTYNFGPGQQQQPGGQQGQGQGGGFGGVLGALGSMLAGAIGGGQHPQGQDQRHQGQQPQQQDGRQQQPQQPDGSQDNRSRSAPGSPRTTVRHFHVPGGHVTIASSSMAFGPGGNFPGPRNAHAPQPFNAQPEMLDAVMAQLLNNINRDIMGPPGHGMQDHPPPPFMMGGPGPLPFDLLNLFAPMGGRMGDAVFSQEDLDRVITQLMEQHQSGNAPGPASEAAIRALPTREVKTSDLDEKTGKAECSICMDEVDIGTTVTELPCHHWFHGDCIKAWLSEHDTCPHCRQGIMPKDGDGPNSQRPRQPSQAPLNDTHAPEYHAPRAMPGGFPSLARQESGSQRNPFTVPDSPEQGRRASSTGPSERRPSRQGSTGGGVFSRMRDAFSPSSSSNAMGGGSGSGAGSGTRGDDPGTKR
jgi:E3 ubiquitin-protein ligase RNF115/126